MPKPAKSQWNFGELFPTAETRRVWTVTALTARVKGLLEQQVGEVGVSGEVSNLRVQASGHCYFTLKDAAAQLSCVVFRAAAAPARALLADGRKVLLHGDLTVYEPRGQYQLVVRAIEAQGEGALQIAFEKLKARLAAEGLFDTARKRPLPRHPQRIGIATSPTGAAIRDVLHVIERRQPGLEIIIAPCRVQGHGAAAEIAEAIRALNAFSSRGAESKLDLILATRGGGSLEDLWAFNEEAVARAIFESALPVISAVGHEIDFTISDLVADLRAATPSAAAEIITEGAVVAAEWVAHARTHMARRAAQALARSRDDLDSALARLRREHPARRIEPKLQRVDELQAALARAAAFGLRNVQARWTVAAQRLARLRPELLVTRRADAFRETRRRLDEFARRRLDALRHRESTASARLKLLSPLHVLDRGYSITTDAATGAIIRSTRAVTPGQNLRTRLRYGTIEGTVRKVEGAPPNPNADNPPAGLR
jgi:exodeoxyribonuclease VII large subunit